MASAAVATDYLAVRKAVFFEDVLKQCCGTGLWQALLVGYMSIMWLLLPTLSMAMMFVGATPKFKCADGFDSNATFNDLPENTPHCHALNSSKGSECSHWVYDQSVYLSTVVTEWDLVCGRKPLLSMLQSWLMIGGIVGSVSSGELSDRFGRRVVFLPFMFLVMICALAAALTSNYSVFAVVRFFSGVAMAAMVGTMNVLVIELTSARRRAMIGVLSFLPYAFGICLVAAASYAIRTRWLLQLGYAIPFLLFVPNVWLMPESPRWLVHHGKFKEAYRVLKTGARWNRKQMPPEQEVFQLMSEAHADMVAQETALQTSVTGGDGVFSRLLDLLRTPRMRRYTLTIMFVFFVITGSYFGLAFDTTQLSNSPHLAATLSGLAEIPGYLCFPVMDRIGRRLSMVTFMTSAGVAMLLVLTKRDPTMWLVLALVAKVGLTCAFSAIFIYSPECMPTQLRGLAVGVSQMALRLGAAVSPFVVDLVSELNAAAPSGVFGGFILLAAMSCLLLPETMGQPMPDTVADVESRPGDGRKQLYSDAAGAAEEDVSEDHAGTINAEDRPGTEMG